MNKLPIPLLIALAAFVLAMGVFVATTDALTYAGAHAETCANCHVMDSMYENYYHAAHEKWAECADCHLPHENIVAYYFEKGRQGAHDVYFFSTGQTPEMIRANEHSQEIIQSNCLRCHENTVEDIMMAGAQPLDRNCWECHRAVAHGERGISTVPYQDSNFYPVK
jgi:cytochrome c nitrite reductase small subunit